MQRFNALIFLTLSTLLLTTGSLAVADEQTPNEAPDAPTASLALELPARDSTGAAIEMAITERLAMTEPDVNRMVEGEVRTSLSMRLAPSAPQS